MRPTAQRDEVSDSQGQDLEATRYAADRAVWQYDVIDSANHLVAAEVERRRYQTLTPVSQVEACIATHDRRRPPHSQH